MRVAEGLGTFGAIEKPYNFTNEVLRFEKELCGKGLAPTVLCGAETWGMRKKVRH